VDTPGFGIETVPRVVKALRDNISFVDAFALVLNFTTEVPSETESLQRIVDLYQTIFGPSFIKNVILVASRWGYSEYDEMIVRGDFTEAVWLEQKKSLLHGRKGVETLKAVYYSPWFLSKSRQDGSFERAMAGLLQFANHSEPFHCKDIVNAQLEIDRLKEKIELQDRLKEKIELQERKIKEKELKDIDPIGQEDTDSGFLPYGLFITAFVIIVVESFFILWVSPIRGGSWGLRGTEEHEGRKKPEISETEVKSVWGDSSETAEDRARNNSELTVDNMDDIGQLEHIPMANMNNMDQNVEQEEQIMNRKELLPYGKESPKNKRKPNKQKRK